MTPIYPTTHARPVKVLAPSLSRTNVNHKHNTDTVILSTTRARGSVSMRHRRQRYAPPSLALVPVLVVLILVIVAEVGEALEHGRGGTGVERRVHNQTRRRAIGGKKRQFNLISELECEL